MYSEPLANQRISIHDCIAQRMTLEKGILTFHFPEGIWVIPGHPSNPTENMVRTGPARMELELLSDDPTWLKVQSSRHLSGPWSLTKEWKTEAFLEALNAGKFRLEFISWHWDFHNPLFQCALHSDRRPWYQNCTLEVTARNVVCHWETMNFNRVW